MDFSQNEYLKYQKPKVPLIKEVVKKILSNLFQLFPLKIIPFNVHFLYAHHVFNDEYENFKSIIWKLKEKFTFVSYSEAVSLLDRGMFDKRYICLSFDDGFKNNFRVADFLNKEKISAMFFINPLVVENCNDENFIINHCKKKLHCKPIEFMNWKELGQLIDWGHEIGNHGYSHKRLSTCDDSGLEMEIDNSLQMILNKLGIKKIHFAWCYGTPNDINPKIIKKIKDNHVSISSAIRGHTNKNSPYIFRDLIIFKDNYKRFLFFYKKNHWKF